VSKTVIHPSAIVEAGAEIGSGTRVGAYAYVGPMVRVGAGCVVDEHVVIKGHTTVGDETEIYSHAVLGGVPQDFKYAGTDTRLLIGERNRIREGVTINIGTESGGGVTVLGNDNLLMANAHVAHDCIIGNRVILANNVMLAGHIRIQEGAILNGGCGVHHFTTIGRFAYVGGLSRITRDVPPYTIVEGHPSRVRGVNVIGLKRARFSDDAINAIKDSFKLLFRSDRPMREALAELKVQYPDIEEVQEMIRFMEASDSGRQGRQGEEIGRGLA
jgi:UDP-N-acetylglucosamine acyltransferase